MSILISVLNVVVALDAVFLILLVVAQSNKGSDLGLFGGSAEMVFGSGQMRAVSRITVTCAFIMMLGVFLIGFLKSFSGNHASVGEKTQGALVLNHLDSTTQKPKAPSSESSISADKSIPSNGKKSG